MIRYSLPYIIKIAAPNFNFASRLFQKGFAGRKVLSNAANKMPHIGMWAKPHIALPIVGASIGAVKSFKDQSRNIQEYKQDKFSFGNLGKSMLIGAGSGAIASKIKPISNVWKKGLSTKMLTPAEQSAFVAKNPTFMRQMTQRNKFLSKAYLNSFKEDLAHPVKSMGAFARNITHKVHIDKDGVQTVYKRSPVGKLTAGAFQIGMPASYIYGTIKDKDASPAEKAMRIGTSSVSYLTPLMFPDMVLNSVPDMIFKRKPAQQQLDTNNELYSQNI